MHAVDMFQLYNVLVGSLTMAGFVYLLTRHRSIGSYNRFVHILLLGLLLFAVGGPLIDLVVPAWSHVGHAIAAILVAHALYTPIRVDLPPDAWPNVALQDPREIRNAGEWMVPMDDEILELFHSTELVLTPSIIAYNTGYSREEVNRRLRELTDHGLMDRVERGKYRITELGESYLIGQYTTTDKTAG